MEDSKLSGPLMGAQRSSAVDEEFDRTNFLEEVRRR
jgi:hypothetical protein